MLRFNSDSCPTLSIHLHDQDPVVSIVNRSTLFRGVKSRQSIDSLGSENDLKSFSSSTSTTLVPDIQHISGIVLIESKRKLKGGPYSIELELIGTLRIFTTASDVTKSAERKQDIYSRAFVSKSIVLLESATPIDPGQHEFGFSFVLDPNMPFSFETRESSITYYLVARFLSKHKLRTVAHKSVSLLYCTPKPVFQPKKKNGFLMSMMDSHTDIRSVLSSTTSSPSINYPSPASSPTPTLARSASSSRVDWIKGLSSPQGWFGYRITIPSSVQYSNFKAKLLVELSVIKSDHISYIISAMGHIEEQHVYAIPHSVESTVDDEHTKLSSPKRTSMFYEFTMNSAVGRNVPYPINKGDATPEHVAQTALEKGELVIMTFTLPFSERTVPTLTLPELHITHSAIFTVLGRDMVGNTVAESIKVPLNILSDPLTIIEQS